MRRANVRITYNMLHTFMGIHSNVEIESIRNDADRRLINVYVASDKEDTGSIRLFDHGEGQQIIQTHLTVEDSIERMREMVRQWDEQHAEEDARVQSREAMNTLYQQLRGDRDGDDDTGHQDTSPEEGQ